jgi:hypothetical protein
MDGTVSQLFVTDGTVPPHKGGAVTSVVTVSRNFRTKKKVQKIYMHLTHIVYNTDLPSSILCSSIYVLPSFCDQLE